MADRLALTFALALVTAPPVLAQSPEAPTASRYEIGGGSGPRAGATDRPRQPVSVGPLPQPAPLLGHPPQRRLGSCSCFGLLRQGGMALTTRSAGTRRVRVHDVAVLEGPLGPHGDLDRLCATVVSCLTSLSSDVIFNLEISYLTIYDRNV